MELDTTTVDKVGGVLGYNQLVYHNWQVRLLVFSSIEMVVASLYALVLCDQWVWGGTMCLSACASLNYWCRPGPGWRRDADYLCALLVLGYAVLCSGHSLNGMPNLTFWWSFSAFVLTCRRSFLLSTGDGGNGVWAQWHAAGHTFIAACCVCGAVGRADDWLHDPTWFVLHPNKNPVGTVTVLLVGLVVAVDVYGSRSRRTAKKLATRARKRLQLHHEDRGTVILQI